MPNQANPTDQQTIEALRLALRQVCLRFNLCSGNPRDVDHHLKESLLAVMHLRKFDGTIDRCVGILDPFCGHPEVATDFDAADVDLVTALADQGRLEILAMASRGTAPASRASVSFPHSMRSGASQPVPRMDDDEL